MPQFLVQVSDSMLRELEKVAPGSSRTRSRFVRLAIQKALMDLEDVETARAYRAMPQDDAGDDDLAGWDEWKPKFPARRAKRTAATAPRKGRRSR